MRLEENLYGNSNKVNQFERIKFKGITGDKKNSRYIEIIRSFTEMCY